MNIFLTILLIHLYQLKFSVANQLSENQICDGVLKHGLDIYRLCHKGNFQHGESTNNIDPQVLQVYIRRCLANQDPHWHAWCRTFPKHLTDLIPNSISSDYEELDNHGADNPWKLQYEINNIQPGFGGISNIGGGDYDSDAEQGGMFQYFPNTKEHKKSPSNNGLMGIGLDMLLGNNKKKPSGGSKWSFPLDGIPSTGQKTKNPSLTAGSMFWPTGNQNKDMWNTGNNNKKYPDLPSGGNSFPDLGMLIPGLTSNSNSDKKKGGMWSALLPNLMQLLKSSKGGSESSMDPFLMNMLMNMKNNNKCDCSTGGNSRISSNLAGRSTTLNPKPSKPRHSKPDGPDEED